MKQKRKPRMRMRMKNVLIILIGTVILIGGMAMYVIDKNTEKADYRLYELGVEFYDDKSYSSAYIVFDCVVDANRNMSNKALNTKFPDILTYKNNSYDEMLYNNIISYINDDQNYKAAIEEAYKMIDAERKDAIISDILSLIDKN